MLFSYGEPESVSTIDPLGNEIFLSSEIYTNYHYFIVVIVLYIKKEYIISRINSNHTVDTFDSVVVLTENILSEFSSVELRSKPPLNISSVTLSAK